MTTTAPLRGSHQAGAVSLAPDRLLRRATWGMVVAFAALALGRTTVHPLGPCHSHVCDPAQLERLWSFRVWAPAWEIQALPAPIPTLAGYAGVVLGAALGVAALVVAARSVLVPRPRRGALAVVLATLPLLSVILIGAMQLATVIYLAGVCAILALRTRWAAITAGTVAVASMVGITPRMATVTSSATSQSVPMGVALACAALIVLGGLCAGVLGAWWRSRAATAAAVAAQERARAAQREAEVADAQTRERARVARDLHDVVAHHISLVAVRAESAPYSQPGLDDGARTVLAEIADDARSALAELRQVLTVLQRHEDAAPLAPQHGAGDVDDLVAEARAAGQPIEDTGEWGDLDAATGYVLYRCVQETLTNARRHAPGSEVLIERGRDTSSVRLEVSNPTGAGATGGDRPDGRGLTGMRERVEALGGSIEVTPGPERFHVVVVLPLGGTQ